MARKPKEATPAVVVVPATPPVVSAPDPALFVWKGVEYDLREFNEFRYWRNADTGVVSAKFLRAAGGEVFVPVSGVDEARQIEAAVNPFWGRV